MKLLDVANALSLEVKSFKDGLQKDVTGAYVSDLLSDVMANSKQGNIWITLQTHLNIVAVASMKGLAGIVIVNGRQVQEEVLKRAEEEKMPIMVTQMPAFEIAGKLYRLLA
ncbi:MAG: serine kinase [Nitrospiraceae bacterium]|nr:MAG: serine kinase [Nitrospiraceae bacterium]